MHKIIFVEWEIFRMSASEIDDDDFMLLFIGWWIGRLVKVSDYELVINDEWAIPKLDVDVWSSLFKKMFSQERVISVVILQLDIFEKERIDRIYCEKSKLRVSKHETMFKRPIFRNRCKNSFKVVAMELVWLWSTAEQKMMPQKIKTIAPNFIAAVFNWNSDINE